MPNKKNNSWNCKINLLHTYLNGLLLFEVSSLAKSINNLAASRKWLAFLYNSMAWRILFSSNKCSGYFASKDEICVGWLYLVANSTAECHWLRLTQVSINMKIYLATYYLFQENMQNFLTFEATLYYQIWLLCAEFWK